MYLVDTNVFIEILLPQNGKEKCKAFLKDHSDSLHISDLTAINFQWPGNTT